RRRTSPPGQRHRGGLRQIRRDGPGERAAGDQRCQASPGAVMSVEVANESGVEVDEDALVALAGHVLDKMGIHPLAELSILIVDETAMAALHEQWMGEP